MSPEESRNQPPGERRQPYPRSRMSADYGSMRRPVAPRNPAAREFTPSPQPSSTTPLTPAAPAPPQPPATSGQQIPVSLQPAPPQPVRPAAVAPKPDFTPPPNYRPQWQPNQQAAPAPPVLPAVPQQQPEPAQPRPKKVRTVKFKKILPMLAVGLLVILGIALLAGIYQWQSKRNNPDTVFQDALRQALSLQSLEIDKTDSDTKQQISYDFSNAKNVTTANQATLKISGAQYGLSTYGTTKNTYISYSKLPEGIDTALSMTVQNGWVQLRTDGQQPASVSTALMGLADPRFQMVGPIIFGNFTAKEQDELTKYLISQKVYAYDLTKVHGATFAGEKVKAYPVKLNSGFLKIANQSAANSKGLSPVDVQKATDALNSLKDAAGTIYIGKGHRFVGMDITVSGKQTVYTYTKANTASLPNEPQTRLSWISFAPYQWQMSAQAANKVNPAVLITERQAKLETFHTYLANYYAVTGSYPSFTNLNNQVWVASNLTSMDPETFRDPQGMTLLLSGAPQANAFSYQPTGNNPKAACDGTAANPCVHYKLTAIVSGSKQASVQDP